MGRAKKAEHRTNKAEPRTIIPYLLTPPVRRTIIKAGVACAGLNFDGKVSLKLSELSMAKSCESFIFDLDQNNNLIIYHNFVYWNISFNCLP